LRAIIADDDPLARRMIRHALEGAGMIIIAEARNGREAVELVLHYRPDVVLMDVVMPDVDGIAATRRIVKEAPDQVIVMLTSGEDDEIGMIGLRAGAAGFLTKNLEIDMLPRALLGAVGGEAAISRRLSMRLVDHLRRAPERTGGLRPVRSPLTPREWDVMELLAERLTTEQIAERLVLASETVRSHVKNILRKLEAHSREEAIVVAQRMQDGAT
jgi:NarL family two-component system response regulator LiaR